MNTSGKFLAMSLILLWGLAPVAASGAAGASAPTSTPLSADQGRAGIPPVEQALVPEGVFAIQLMEALKMGSAQDEAQAESQLSAIGVEPKNGWIAGYPMTPPAMVEIEKSIAAAAEGGKLKMSKEEALRAVGELKTKLGLDISPEASSQAPGTAGARPASTIIYKYTDRNGVIHFTDQYESIPKEYRDRIEMIRETVRPPSSEEPAGRERETPVESSIPSPGPEVVNNYYYDYGPPVVTYYAPPAPYYYLYSWVPYPFWWGPGVFFSGYFILHDFHRHVGFHGRPFVCSNHVVAHKRWYSVNPQTRGVQNSGMVGRVSSPQVFHSPRVQSSARAIVGHSQNRHAPLSVAAHPRMAAPAPTSSAPRFQAPPRPTTQQRVTKGPANTQGGRFIRTPGMAGVTSTPTAPQLQGPPRPTTQQRVTNSQGGVPSANFKGPGAAAGRTFNPPSSGGKFFSPSPSRAAGAPTAPVMQGPVFSAPAPSGKGSFGSGRSSQGFSGGGLSGRGGSFQGGSMGGRR